MEVEKLSFPRHSIHAIYAYMRVVWGVNVGMYGIHGVFGFVHKGQSSKALCFYSTSMCSSWYLTMCTISSWALALVRHPGTLVSMFPPQGGTGRIPHCGGFRRPCYTRWTQPSGADGPLSS